MWFLFHYQKMNKEKFFKAIEMKLDHISKIMEVTSPESANILYNLINTELGFLLNSTKFKVKASGAIAHHTNLRLQQLMTTNETVQELHLKYKTELEENTRREQLEIQQIQELEDIVIETLGVKKGKRIRLSSSSE